MPLEAIETRRLYQIVADQIGELIRSGEYRSGDRLPPERDLSRRLGVSRPVVREAMVALEVVGLVEVRGGSGVYVCDLSAPAEVPDFGEDPYDSFVARRLLEGEIAAAAAIRADPQGLAELSAAYAAMVEEAKGSPKATNADRRFHFALARASGNSIYFRLINFIWDELLDRGPIWDRLIARRSIRKSKIAEHKAILDAVLAGDADAARLAMQVHLDNAAQDVLGRTSPSAAGAADQAEAAS